MAKEYMKIVGLVDMQDNPVDNLEFSDKVLEFMEENGWHLVGVADYYLDEDDEDCDKLTPHKRVQVEGSVKRRRRNI